MSITFWCPDAPTNRVCPYPEQDADFFIDESVLPEINLANSNAAAALDMMGLPYDDAGCLGAEQLDGVLARLQSFLATGTERAALLEPHTVNGRCVVPQPVEALPRLTFSSEGGASRVTEAPSAEDAGPLTLGQLLTAKLSVATTTGGTYEELMRESHRGPRIISMGRDDDYLVRTATRFVALLQLAKEHGYRVCWG